ncbi:hypothetical protein AB0D97_32610 [Streptomyces roseus]|uniref:hypothetical protein n=1 Tax=Streptomyces roseus TaxID=66430 RepID=UPI0033D80ADB
MREALDLGDEVPVIALDARNRDSVRDILAAFMDFVVQQRSGGTARRSWELAH